MLYVINASVLPLKEGKEYSIKARQISIQEASEMLKKEKFVSAVGHEATAKLLSTVLGVDVPMNRIQISLDYGDKLLAFMLKKRLEEGKVIKSVEELEAIGYTFWYFEIQSPNQA